MLVLLVDRLVPELEYVVPVLDPGRDRIPELLNQGEVRVVELGRAAPLGGYTLVVAIGEADHVVVHDDEEPGVGRILDVLLKKGEGLALVVAPGGRVDAEAHHVRPPVPRQLAVLLRGVPLLYVEVVDVLRGTAAQAHR